MPGSDPTFPGPPKRIGDAAHPSTRMDPPATELARAPEAARSFEGFYEAESATLFRRLCLVTGNRAEAEEIMQDAFLRIWERWDRVQAVGDPTGYLYRTAMNVFRRRYQRTVLALRRAVSVGSAVDEFAAADDRQLVRRVLAELSPKQRAVLVLTEMLGFSAKEAAVALGVSTATVRSLAFRGRAAFKEAMETVDE
jgi:RNA polymerase sigma-70 factor, ECF subfamily